jgi:predicted dehydrogenase
MVKLWMEHNRRPWHLTPQTGGGMLLTAGIHALDRLVWLMDAQVAAVAAIAGHLFHDHAVPDAEVLLLRFAGGALGDVASVGTRDKTMLNATELFCEGGSLSLDFDGGVRIGRGGHVTLLPGATEPDWLPRGLAREWQAMAAAINDGVPPPVGAAEAGHLIACIAAAQQAAAERREVAVAAWPAILPQR